MSKGHILCDFDGTLAIHDKWQGPQFCGPPIMPMINRVRKWLKDGVDVRIFTARIFPIGTIFQNDPTYEKRVEEALVATETIHKFCKEQFGRVLPIQCYKEYATLAIYDDRAVQVMPNTGVLVEELIHTITL